MDYVILDVYDPDDELFQRWAYDERLCFVSQDEDIILAVDENIPTLLKLVQDPACPKGAYIADILGLWAREAALGALGSYGPDKAVTARKDLETLSDTFVPGSQAASDFATYLRRLTKWITPVPRSDDEIRILIRDLARDRYGVRDEDRWVINRYERATTVAVPYGAESLNYWQLFVVDDTGVVTSQLDLSGQH